MTIDFKDRLWHYLYPPQQLEDPVQREKAARLGAEIETWYADFHQRMPPDFKGLPETVRGSTSDDLDEPLSQYMRLLSYEFRQPFSYRKKKIEDHFINILKMVLPLLMGRKIRVLDAGCGFGSDAILFGLCGAEVIGVDLFPGLVQIAGLRKRLYEEYFGVHPDVQFRAENLLNLTGNLTYNLIWSNGSIEHIHPVEDFLQVCWDRLEPGGRLIIANVNGLSPYAQLKALYARGFNLYREKFADPVSGDCVVYAMERLLAFPWLKAALRKPGFEIVSVVTQGLIPAFFVRGRRSYELTRNLERLLAAVPGVSFVMEGYVIVAEKPS
jgi:SAM-dependent methyltransferase